VRGIVDCRSLIAGKSRSGAEINDWLCLQQVIIAEICKERHARYARRGLNSGSFSATKFWVSSHPKTTMCTLRNETH
jgi:hypothetical protein